MQSLMDLNIDINLNMNIVNKKIQMLIIVVIVIRMLFIFFSMFLIVIIIEDICRICQKRADVTCICNKDLRFCFEHVVEHLDIPKGQHKSINLKMFKLVEKCKFNLEKIIQVKSEIIRRSNYIYG